MDKAATTQIATIERYEFSTDDIEQIIQEKYKFSGDVDFCWHVGQWVSLTVKVKKENCKIRAFYTRTLTRARTRG